MAANDASAWVASFFCHGLGGLQQNQAKAEELYARAAELGSSQPHYLLADVYCQQGDWKKTKFYLEEAAMAGHEVAINNLACLEAESVGRAIKYWVGASAGCYCAMHTLRKYRTLKQVLLVETQLTQL